MPTFFRNESGSATERLAVVTALVAAASILGAHYMERLSQSGGLPRIALISPDGSTTTLGGIFASLSSSPATPTPHFGNIDYSSTGSLPPDMSSRPIVLDPCTGQSKQ